MIHGPSNVKFKLYVTYHSFECSGFMLAQVRDGWRAFVNTILNPIGP